MRSQEQVHSLRDFKQNTSAHLRRLKRSGRAEKLTVGGEVQLVVQDAKTYARLESEAEFARHIKALRKSIAEADRGEGRRVREAFEDIAKKHGIKLET